MHPNDALGADIVDAQDLVDREEVIEAFDVVQDGWALPATVEGLTRCPKICAQFGRQRTHNEQVIVAPCGMIIARETFYGAEAVSTVVVSWVLLCFLSILTVCHCFRR